MMSPEDFEQILKLSAVLERMKKAGVIKNFKMEPSGTLESSMISLEIPEEHILDFSPDELMKNQSTH